MRGRLAAKAAIIAYSWRQMKPIGEIDVSLRVQTERSRAGLGE